MAIGKINNISNSKAKQNQEFDFTKLSNSVKTPIATKIKVVKQKSNKRKVTIPAHGQKVPDASANPTVKYTDRHEQFKPKVVRQKSPKFDDTIKEAEIKALQSIAEFNNEFKGMAHINIAEGDMLPHARQLDALKTTIGNDHTNLGLSQKNIWSPDDEYKNGMDSPSDQGPEDELAINSTVGNSNII